MPNGTGHKDQVCGFFVEIISKVPTMTNAEQNHQLKASESNADVVVVVVETMAAIAAKLKSMPARIETIAKRIAESIGDQRSQAIKDIFDLSWELVALYQALQTARTGGAGAS